MIKFVVAIVLLILLFLNAEIINERVSVYDNKTATTEIITKKNESKLNADMITLGETGNILMATKSERVDKSADEYRQVDSAIKVIIESAGSIGCDILKKLNASHENKHQLSAKGVGFINTVLDHYCPNDNDKNEEPSNNAPHIKIGFLQIIQNNRNTFIFN